jgi:SAM-dependent methyltransferase
MVELYFDYVHSEKSGAIRTCTKFRQIRHFSSSSDPAAVNPRTQTRIISDSPSLFKPMNTREIISTVKYLSSTKRTFLLSELRTYLTGDVPLTELYRTLTPHLHRLDLAATEVDDDYEISRTEKPSEYMLNADENKRIDAFLAARHLPAALERAIEQYITKKVGKSWDDPVILERLRRAIVAQKDDYWKPSQRQRLQYTKGYRVLSYLAYHFPVYFMQTGHLLAMLARDGLLKKTMTVLDAGTGPGVVPLAIAEFYSRLDDATATVYSVERSEEHIEAFMYLRDHCTKKDANASIKPPIRADITTFDPAQIPQQVDLLVFSNVLNELIDASLEQRADLVMRFAERLSPDGTILIVEPAEEVTSMQLRILSLALKKRGLTIHSPCSFIWGTNCTPDRCWSFVTAPSIKPIHLMGTLAACEEPFRYVNTDIKYSYVVLRKDGKTREAYHVPAGSRVLRLSQIHRHVGKRVNLIAAKMSENLGDAKTLMFKICDGSAEKPAYAVVPSYHITMDNKEIVSAPYGSILELQNVLVRHNPKHDAYNVLVTRDTRVAFPKLGDYYKKANI